MKCKLNLLWVRKPWNKICPCFHYHFLLKVCVTVARSQSMAVNQLAMQWKTYTMFIAFYAAAVVRTVCLHSRRLEVICKKKWGTAGQSHKRGDGALSLCVSHLRTPFFLAPITFKPLMPRLWQEVNKNLSIKK